MSSNLANANKLGSSAGNRGRGRPKGSTNKTTGVLKDAILKAAILEGEDGKGKGKLTGYLRRVAREDVKAFSGLLGKVLPMTIAGDPNNPMTVTLIREEIVDPAK
jgi:hypothetical protein